MLDGTPRGVSASLVMIVGCLLIIAGSKTPLMAQEITPELFSQLRYRHIGPDGNRTSAVVGAPGDPMIYYIGAASGGVWKSVDAGLNWNPVFDDQPVQSIGALAIASSDHNVVWAGTGEAFIRSNVSIGNGVYKSTDAGKTWRHMGLEKSGRIGRVWIDPKDPDIVLVGVLGHCYGPQKERGVFRTTDGGKSWKHVLFADEDTGCFEIAVNPVNPRIMFAGMWPLEIHTYGRESGGPKGGIYRSTDSGVTWKQLTGRGLPKAPIGKVGIAIAQSNPDVVYALMETGHPNRGVLWRSTNNGDSWTCVSHDRILNERPHYASRIMVNPADEDEIYFAANSHSISYDGGKTTERSGWSGDAHDMWADPLNPDRMMISDDGGALITMNRGESWNRIDLPIAQMYHVAVDNQIPYYVYGGKQDGSAYKGPSTNRGRSFKAWKSTAGSECGFIVPDPVDPNIVWGGGYTASLARVDYRTGHQRSVKVWPESTYGASAGEHVYRFNWTFPITISPHDHNKVYVASQYVHVTTDAGNSWQIISGDLSTNDASKMGPSGGLTKDNIGVENACLIFALAESRLEKGCIWAGTNDGLLHVTRDGGKSWSNVTGSIPDLPVWGTFSNIEPSRYNAGTAYVTVDYHQMNNRDPYVYKTADYGKTWKSISSNIPRSVFSYCHWVHEDPKREGLLYVGTENAIYVSFNDGASWLPLQNNLPQAPVHHMVIQEHFNDLVVATYGRGFWIMDDITPLQQLTEEVLVSDAHLFEPRNAYRFIRVTGGPTARASANINYYLKSAAKGRVDLKILDSNGETVNTLKGPSKKGINRVSWNLKGPRAEQARLRVPPEGNPRVVEEKRFRTQYIRDGWFPILSWGTSGGYRGITVAPGEYTIVMTVDGKEYRRQLNVLKDPKSAGTLSDIRATVAMQREVRKDILAVTELVNRMEWLRRQLRDLQKALKANDGSPEVIAAASELEDKVQAVEDKVVQPYSKEGDSKSFRFANLLYAKMSVLGGDLARNADFAPNEQQRLVHAKLKRELQFQSAQFKEILDRDLPAFNKVLKDQGIGGVVINRAE